MHANQHSPSSVSMSSFTSLLSVNALKHIFKSSMRPWRSRSIFFIENMCVFSLTFIVKFMYFQLISLKSNMILRGKKDRSVLLFICQRIYIGTLSRLLRADVVKCTWFLIRYWNFVQLLVTPHFMNIVGNHSLIRNQIRSYDEDMIYADKLSANSWHLEGSVEHFQLSTWWKRIEA